MSTLLTATIAGAIGTFAFSIIYHLSPKHLPFTFIGGALTTFILVLTLYLPDSSILFSNMCAAFTGGVFCHICSYWRKAPFTAFIIPTIFPLVPGRNLYFSMIALMQHSRTQFADNFYDAIEISFGIAVGLTLSILVNKMIFLPLFHRKKMTVR